MVIYYCLIFTYTIPRKLLRNWKLDHLKVFSRTNLFLKLNLTIEKRRHVYYVKLFAKHIMFIVL